MPDALAAIAEAELAVPVALSDGLVRTALMDGDEVVITVRSNGSGAATIGFGQVRGRVMPGPPEP